MEEMLPELRRQWLRGMIPAAGLFALAYVLTRLTGPCTTPAQGVYILLALLALIFVGFLATTIYFRRAASQARDDGGAEAAARYRRAYVARVCTLTALAALCSAAWVATHEENCAYLDGILALIIALLYPSRTFVLGRDNRE